MNGEAASGGIDGEIYRSDGPGILTVEATNRGDRTVHMWAYVSGEEQLGVSFPPSVLRALAADLRARADLIDQA